MKPPRLTPATLLGGALCPFAAALLWGASLSAEQSSNQALCLARMRDLAMAARNYAADHHDTLPPAADRSQHPWKWWYHAIFPYTDSVASFYCPQLLEDEHATLQRSRLLPMSWNHRFISYGIAYPVDAFQQKQGRLRLSAISQPHRKILFGESHALILRNTAQFWAKDVAPRHASRANFVTFSGEGISAEGLPGQAPSPMGVGIHDAASWSLP